MQLILNSFGIEYIVVKIKLFSLNRISFGSVHIGDLKLGEYRLLSEKEINRLKKAV